MSRNSQVVMTATQDGRGAVRRHFAHVAGVYEAVRTTDVEPVRDLVTSLPAGALRGLEVGCGTGRYTELLLAHLEAGSSIVGVDACFEMLQVLRRTVRPDAAILPVCGDAAALSLPEGVLDFVAQWSRAPPRPERLGPGDGRPQRDVPGRRRG